MSLAGKRLLLASSNKGKIREISDMLAPRGIAVCSLLDYPDLEPPEETGQTYQENSHQKALWGFRQTGLPTVADDSGLEVHAMENKPGVFSARFMGENTPYPDKMKSILTSLKDSKGPARKARFVCVMILVLRENSWYGSRGVVSGRIAHEPAGSYGFGYDPIFIPDGHDRTFGEIGKEIKNTMSHRSQALADIVTMLPLLLT